MFSLMAMKSLTDKLYSVQFWLSFTSSQRAGRERVWVDQAQGPAGAWLRDGERDELRMGGQQMVLFMRNVSDIK